MADILDAVSDELEAQGITRRPTNAGAPPPLWLQPRDGVPAPGEGTGVKVGPTIVAAVYRVNGLDDAPLEEGYEWHGLEFHFRALTWPAIYGLYKQIRAVIARPQRYTLGGIEVFNYDPEGGLQPAGSDAQGYNAVARWAVWTVSA